MNNNINNVKYPKSINDRQCIGPCYRAGTIAIHPVTLEQMKADHNYCPVDEYQDIDSKGHTSIFITDKCYNPLDSKKNDIDALATKMNNEINILIPTINLFDLKKFLNTFYEINNFESLIKWLEPNNYLPYFTRKRVVMCSIMVFITDIDIVDMKLVSFFIEIIKREWIHILYKNIKHYIHYDDKKEQIYFKQPSKTDNLDKTSKPDKISKMNYIILKIANETFLHKFLSKYLVDITSDTENNYKSNKNIENDILNNLIEYTLSKLNSIK